MKRKTLTDDQFYQNTGLKTKRSRKREETAAGSLAAYILDRIPENYDVWEDCDINQVHLADEIVKNCGRYIRFCPQIGWMVYKAGEGRWTEIYAESAVERIIIHFGNLLFEGSKESRTEEKTFARAILSSAGIHSIKNILKKNTVIAVEQDRFDADTGRVNCAGEMYDLRTGETRPCEPEDMFNMKVFCKPSGLKKAAANEDGRVWEMPKVPKKFGDFMMEVTSKEGVERPDLATYIISWFGYCLTGDTGASFFVNFHGMGNNGKSQLLTLMLDLFGDYAIALPKDVVIENFNQGQFDLAGLPGKRLGVLIDAPEGRLNMDQLKSIISGDPVNAKRKYLKDFTFNPVIKIAVGSNPKLTLKDTGMAVRRRVRMVPFDYLVLPEEEITGFSKILLNEEGPEILALLIYFANKYYRKGMGKKALPYCKIVDEASAEYLESEDLVGRWKTERTEVLTDGEESSADLYEDFKIWCAAEGIRKVMSRNKFGEHLGAKLKRDKIGDVYYYLDVKLKYKPDKAAADGGG